MILPVLTIMAKFFINKWKPGLNQRLGKFNKEDFPAGTFAKAIWFHAVSVGEFNALSPLLKHFDGLQLIISVTTTAAYNLASKKLKDKIELNQIKLIYMPWDHPKIIAKTLDLIKPQLIVLMESEIWPALINESHKRQIKIAIINAKISDKSFGYYKKIKWVFKDLLNKISLIIAQSANDSRKYIELKGNQKGVYMFGNMKFSLEIDIKAEDAKSLKKSLNYQDGDLIITAASTHEEEEAVLIAMFQELKEEFDFIRLIIAPRHPERFKVVENFIQSAAKLQAFKITDFKKTKTSKINNSNDVLLIDSIGDLLEIYAISNIAFVGGTLNEKIGGHNVLEPAIFKLPVVIGPHYHKNKTMVEMMQSAGALIVTESKLDLKETMKSLITNNDQRILMGAMGKKLTDENKKIISQIIIKLKEMVN
jgi:3-deoxy-D-manno-octulosonic-acid transferase